MQPGNKLQQIYAGTPTLMRFFWYVVLGLFLYIPIVILVGVSLESIGVGSTAAGRVSVFVSIPLVGYLIRIVLLPMRRHVEKFAMSKSDGRVNVSVPGLLMTYESKDNVVTIVQDKNPPIRVCRSILKIEENDNKSIESVTVPHVGTSDGDVVIVNPGGTFSREVTNGWSITVYASYLKAICPYFSLATPDRNLTPEPQLGRFRSFHDHIYTNVKGYRDFYSHFLLTFYRETDAASEKWILEHKNSIIKDAVKNANKNNDEHLRELRSFCETNKCDPNSCIVEGVPFDPTRDHRPVLLAVKSSGKGLVYRSNENYSELQFSDVKVFYPEKGGPQGTEIVGVLAEDKNGKSFSILRGEPLSFIWTDRYDPYQPFYLQPSQQTIKFADLIERLNDIRQKPETALFCTDLKKWEERQQLSSNKSDKNFWKHDRKQEEDLSLHVEHLLAQSIGRELSDPEKSAVLKMTRLLAPFAGLYLSEKKWDVLELSDLVQRMRMGNYEDLTKDARHNLPIDNDLYAQIIEVVAIRVRELFLTSLKGNS